MSEPRTGRKGFGAGGDACPSCYLLYDSGKKRCLMDACGHERCYTCMFTGDDCPLCFGTTGMHAARHFNLYIVSLSLLSLNPETTVDCTFMSFELTYAHTDDGPWPYLTGQGQSHVILQHYSCNLLLYDILSQISCIISYECYIDFHKFGT